MYSTLLNLFDGNFDFHKRKHEELPLEKYHSKEYDKIKKQLDNQLNEDGRKLLNELLDTHVDGSNYSDTEAFINGFRIATMLMVEVFYDKDSILDNKEQYLRHMLHRPFKGTPSPLDDLPKNE